MSKEPNNIDRLVREKLDGFEMTPPPSVWSNTSTSLKAGKQKRFLIWFALGIAAIAILGTGAYYLSSEDTPNELLASGNSSNQADKFDKDNDPANNGESGANKAGNGKNNPDSDNELNSENLSSSDEDITSEEINSSRSFSSINPNMTRKKIEAREKQNTSNKQSQKNNSSQQNQTGPNPSSNNTLGSLNTTQKGNHSQKQSTKNTNSSHQSSTGVNSLGNETLGQQNAQQTINDSNGTKSYTTEAESGNSSENNNSTVPSNLKNSNGDQLIEQGSTKSYFSGKYNLLPTAPIEFLTAEQPKRQTTKFGEKLNTVKAPFWKSLSIEGSFGMSMFKNQPKKPTSSSLSNAINNAASGQQSIDFRFGLNYHFTDRFSFQSGIHYNSMKENYAYDSEEIVTYTNIDTMSYTVDSMTLDTTWITNTTTYDTTIISSEIAENTYRIFTLPFQFSWSKRISPRGIFEFSLGGAVSFSGKNTGSVIVNSTGATIEAQQGYHTKGMTSFGGSFKYIHRFGNHHSIYIEPWAQFGITTHSYKYLTYETYRRRYGIRFGYRFYF